MRFVADTMPGRLAKWLRLLRDDALHWRGDDAWLVRITPGCGTCSIGWLL